MDPSLRPNVGCQINSNRIFLATEKLWSTEPSWTPHTHRIYCLFHCCGLVAGDATLLQLQSESKRTATTINRLLWIKWERKSKGRAWRRQRKKTAGKKMEISSDVSEPSNELSAETLCNIRLWSAAIPDQFVSIKMFSYRCGTTEPSVSFRQRGNERSFEERRREIHKILSSNIPLRLINAGRHTHTLTSTSHRRHDQSRQHAQARTPLTFNHPRHWCFPLIRLLWATKLWATNRREPWNDLS